MSASDHSGAARVRAVTRPPSDALQRFQRGELTLDEYLDERTELALNHVRGKISPEALESVRAAVRDQLETDPVLTELVRKATGHVPSPPAENTG
jgi:hypothetical protein